MGKNRRLKNSSTGAHKKPKPSQLTRPAGISKPQPNSQPQKKKHVQLSQNKPIIPFTKNESILLVGEGDLSFSRSLIEHHGCKNITATVLEPTEAELVEKYPQAEGNIANITEGGGLIKFCIDVGKKNGSGVKVLRAQRFDRIFFNFPHVGGKSTDVNRQVRYNQELLVSFFHNTLPLLSPKPGSSILVTLFEGSPYSLWNIRDLGRHSGLEVKKSWRFQAHVWKGYAHARTLGVVKGGGGWKGEEREARTFEFVRKGEGQVQGTGKQKGGSEESSDEDEDHSDMDMEGDEEDMLHDSNTDSEAEEESWEGFESDDTNENHSQDDAG